MFVEPHAYASSKFFPIATQPIPYKDYTADSHEPSTRCSSSLVVPRAFAMSELSRVALSIRRLKFYAADL